MNEWISHYSKCMEFNAQILRDLPSLTWPAACLSVMDPSAVTRSINSPGGRRVRRSNPSEKKKETNKNINLTRTQLKLICTTHKT